MIKVSPLRREIRRLGPYRVTLGPARLFLDDVQDIVRYLKKVGSTSNPDQPGLEVESSEQEDLFKDGVAIGAVNAIADSVEDLCETTRDELEQVTILHDKPIVQVDLWKYSAEVLVYPNDAASRMIADDIAAFIRDRRRWFSTCRFCLLLFTIGIVTIPLLVIVNVGHSHSHWYNNIYVPLLVIGAAIVGTAQDTYNAYRYGTVTIVPSWRKERRILSQQSRQAYVVAILGAVAGSILTWLLAR